MSSANSVDEIVLEELAGLEGSINRLMQSEVQKAVIRIRKRIAVELTRSIGAQVATLIAGSHTPQARAAVRNASGPDKRGPMTEARWKEREITRQKMHNFVTGHPGCSILEIEEHCGLKRTSTIRLLRELRERKLLSMRGDRSAARYYPTNKSYVPEPLPVRAKTGPKPKAPAASKAKAPRKAAKPAAKTSANKSGTVHRRKKKPAQKPAKAAETKKANGQSGPTQMALMN